MHMAAERRKHVLSLFPLPLTHSLFSRQDLRFNWLNRGHRRLPHKLSKSLQFLLQYPLLYLRSSSSLPPPPSTPPPPFTIHHYHHHHHHHHHHNFVFVYSCIHVCFLLLSASSQAGSIRLLMRHHKELAQFPTWLCTVRRHN
jgi:hypothetical protein